MSSKTIAALGRLDPKNDSHWTSDGLPRLDSVKLFASDPALTREAVTAAAPGFSRSSPVLPGEPAAGATIDPAPEQGAGTLATVAPVAAQPGAIDGGGDGTEEDGDGVGATGDASEPQGTDTQAALQAAHERLEQASARKAQADQEHQKAVEELDAAIIANSKSGTQETLADHLRGYLDSQRAALQRRGEQQQRIRDAGINLKDLLPSRAPLDVALARKTGRGTQRPNLPLKG